MMRESPFFYWVWVLCSILACTPAYSQWNPQDCLSKEEMPILESLQNPQLLELKLQVAKYLEGSWCSADKSNLIIDLIILKQPSLCVEIGVFTGSSFLPIVAALSFLQKGRAYAIDSWSNLAAVRGISQNDSHFHWWVNVDMIKISNQFFKTMNEWSLTPFYTLICDRSNNVFSLFNQIDFLHLDGNFSEEGSSEDVALFLPKVSPGGYILLSNAFMNLDQHYFKMKAIWMLLEECEVIAEIENSNTILFQKNFF